MTWEAAAEQLAQELPSPTLRASAAKLLAIVETLGPLLDKNRTRADEIKRVYKFLTFNEPLIVERVVAELSAAATGREAGLGIRHNAWNYVVSFYDRWLLCARVSYVVTGLLEGALRARVNSRLTDEYGETWPSEPGVVPESLLKQDRDADLAQTIAAALRIIDGEHDPHATLAEVKDKLSAPRANTPRNGSEYAHGLTFASLRTLIETKRLWNRGPNLQTIFVADNGKPPMRTEITAVLAILHDARNDVAHYKASKKRSFTEILFGAAKLAKWLEVDLQHFYSSVDTRESTELSLLIEYPERSVLDKVLDAKRKCEAGGCDRSRDTSQLACMLSAAPTNRSELDATRTEVACLEHRVTARIARVRPALTTS